MRLNVTVGGHEILLLCWLPVFPPPRHPRELRCHVGHDMQSLISPQQRFTIQCSWGGPPAFREAPRKKEG